MMFKTKLKKNQAFLFLSRKAWHNEDMETLKKDELR